MNNLQDLPACASFTIARAGIFALDVNFGDELKKNKKCSMMKKILLEDKNENYISKPAKRSRK